MTSRPRLVYSQDEPRAWSSVKDRELLTEGVCLGDELALQELIRRKTQPLVQVAYRVLGDLEEARDVVQISFLKIWNHRERYNRKWSPNTWMYRITTNLAIDHLRSRKSKERAQEPLKHHFALRQVAQRDEGGRSLDSQEVDGIFRELAQFLTEKQRAVFVLRELEGLESREVAKIVGCRQSTVRNHLFNARKILRVKLLERYPEYARAFEEKGS